MRCVVLPSLLLCFTLACPTAEEPPAPQALEPLQPWSGITGTLLQVADFQPPCRADDVIEACLAIRFEGDDAWTEFHGRVDDSIAEWGLRELLDVEVTVDPDTQEESYTKLESLQQEDRAGRVFELQMAPEYLIGGARLIGGREIDCDEWELCNALDERLSVGDRFDVWLQHPESIADPLILVAIPGT